MKISEIRIDSFGHWKGLRVPDLSDGVTVIYGPNEAGKSTLLQLIRAVLYGFSPHQHGRFVPPLHAGPVGGTIKVSAPNGRFQICRHLPSSGRLADHRRSELSVKSTDGSIRGKHLLASLLSGVDETLFQNVFAVGLSEIQQLGTLSDTEAAQQLFGLASGSDRVSISDVARQLDKQRATLVDHAERGIKQNLSRRSELEKEARQVQQSTKDWLELREAREQLSDELDRLERRRRDFGENVDGASPNPVIRKRWKACLRLHRELKELGPLPDIPTEALDRLEKLTRQLTAFRAQWEKIRERRRSLKGQARQLDYRPQLLQHGEPIDAFRRQRASIGSLAEELSKLKTRFEETEFELQAEMERLGMSSAWQLESMPLITHEVVETLREPARDARDVRRELEAAQRERDEGSNAVKRAHAEVQVALGVRGSANLTAALKDAQSQVDLLRQQIECDAHLVRLRRNQQEVREEIGYWTQRQVLSWRGVLTIGLIFSLGVVVMMASLFGTTFGISPEHRWMVTLIGGAISFVAIVVKNVVGYSAVRRADACRDESDELQAQADQLTEQIEQAARQLPADSRPLPLLLSEKQAELERLSELEPLEEKRLAAQQVVDAAAASIESAELRLRDARSRWRQTLRRLGLPEGMTPTQFGRLSQRDGKLGTLRERFIELKQEIQQRQDDLDSHAQRVKLLAERVDVVFDSNALEDQIDELAQLLQDARGQLTERETLHRNWRQLRQEQEKVARAAKRLQQRRRKLVAQYGLSDAQDLKHIVARRTRAAQLKSQTDEALRHVSHLLGPCVPTDVLRRQLTEGGFEDHLETLETEQHQTVTRIAELHERRGELNEKLKSLARNRQATTIRLEELEIEKQLAHSIHQWATSAAISRALTNVQTAYESDQQPETLADASGYLNRMTEGRYQRTWTPFGESTLCVDGADGRASGIEVLSRGTREQVFLSLRLALAAAYSRRGAPMPVILDDVLVNFDAQRARAAAQTICEFAAVGHQVLVFTCHDHIRDIFKALNVDVRGLPSPETVANQGADVVSERSSTAPGPAITAPPAELLEAPGMPLDNDPELDHELLYGAPEYDPGYEDPDAREGVAERVPPREEITDVGLDWPPHDRLPMTPATGDAIWAARYNAEVDDRR